MHAARRHEHGRQEREHHEDLERELEVRVLRERPPVAEQQHEAGEAEQHAEHADAASERRIRDEEIEDDEDQQQPLDLGDAAREAAQLGLLDLEATLDGVATHGDTLTAARRRRRASRHRAAA